FVILLAGCSSKPKEEILYTHDHKGARLKISHINNGATSHVTITNLEEAKEYKVRLRKMISAIEDFEKQLKIQEQK
ncbi:MAG: hypothetical protein GTO02_18925, partial [Candidatus Dadabacteria bacterium]|nr:hypothetical protein [Candidatus Dadabacteria bacterium]